ncbi:Afadin and alpha-actinin-binding-domain-containing protein [Gorgonomyces haynaldii]|nr:Afadin and alpha-actinin-binding-domain-containing protein [Gorgonomyces haynaldii]
MLTNALETRDDQTQQYVNRELESLGFPKLEGPHDQTSVNTIFSLLQQRQKDIMYRQDLQDRIRKMDDDQHLLQSQVQRQLVKIENLNRDNGSLSHKLSNLETQHEDLKSKFQAQKEELKATKSNAVFQRGQFEHEIRKKQRELERMRDRLAKLMADRTVSEISFKLMNPLKRVVKGAKEPQKSTEEKDQDAMLKIVLDDYEHREQMVLSENQLLRDCLHRLYQSLYQTLQSQHLTALKDSVFKLPFEDVQTTIEENTQYCNQLLVELQQSAKTLDAQKQLEEMHKKQATLEMKIAEQQKLLDIAVNTQVPQSENDDLERERLELEEQRRKLDEERKGFTEAAIRMGVERANLQRERQRLEALKEQNDTQAVVDTFPPTPKYCI